MVWSVTAPTPRAALCADPEPSLPRDLAVPRQDKPGPVPPSTQPPGPSLEVNQYLISCLSSCCWGDALLPAPLSMSRDDLVQDEAVLSQGVGICRAEGIWEFLSHFPRDPRTQLWCLCLPSPSSVTGHCHSHTECVRCVCVCVCVLNSQQALNSLEWYSWEFHHRYLNFWVSFYWLCGQFRLSYYLFV